MKKVIVIFFIFYFWVYALANAFSKANADEYTNAVVGHVIVETINGNMNHGALLESELNKLAHNFAIESMVILQKYLPSILEGIAADMRLEADKKYKCKLLEGSPNGCN
jgi:hypothetical protein